MPSIVTQPERTVYQQMVRSRTTTISWVTSRQSFSDIDAALAYAAELTREGAVDLPLEIKA
jgi:hypothetical protein